MIRIILICFIYSFYLNANDNLIAQKQNTLYVQNLIGIEEHIAKNFEKYILTEFKLPTITDLIDDSYLGSNFSIENKMGVNIDFSDTKTLRIKYLISKDEYNDTGSYVTQLYNRDLYRNFTRVFYDEEEKDNIKRVVLSSSYVEMKLQSDEAKIIFDLLKNGNVIQKNCTSSLVSTYCSNNQKSIRWYNASSQWIEYSKKDFNKGNVILSNTDLLTNLKLKDLIVGAYLFVDGVKYVKLINASSDGSPDGFPDGSPYELQILKVN